LLRLAVHPQSQALRAATLFWVLTQLLRLTVHPQSQALRAATLFWVLTDDNLNRKEGCSATFFAI